MTGGRRQEPGPEDAVPRWLWRLSRLLVVGFVAAVAALVVVAVVAFAVR